MAWYDLFKLFTYGPCFGEDGPKRREIKIIKPEEMTVVPKGWGREEWIWNKTHCLKKLYVNKDKKCSWHYHRLKHEAFYIEYGQIVLMHGWSDDIEKATCLFMEKGDTIEIPVGLRHQFYAIEDSLILETSTTHYDTDSIRITKGD